MQYQKVGENTIDDSLRKINESNQKISQKLKLPAITINDLKERKQKIQNSENVFGTQMIGTGFISDPFGTRNYGEQPILASQNNEKEPGNNQYKAHLNIYQFGCTSNESSAKMNQQQKSQYETQSNSVKQNIKQQEQSQQKQNISALLPKEMLDQIELLGKYIPGAEINLSRLNIAPQKLKDGSLYEGGLVNDKKHGFGYHFQDKEFYSGYFVNDKRYGQGKVIYMNGDYIIGNWVDGVISGNVKFKRNGDYYCGQCKQNLIPHGVGFYRNQDYKYQGDFQNWKKNGIGQKYNFSDESIYWGEFQSDRMHGKGEILFNNEKFYRGCFKNNKFEGEGEIIWHDGSCYFGMFKNNFRHGYGTMLDKDGNIIEGQWEEDELKVKQ